MKNGFAWFKVSMREWSECWNCAVTVNGCFLALLPPEELLPVPAVPPVPVLPANVLTLCKFFKPFFPRSRGRNDLFFL